MLQAAKKSACRWNTSAFISSRTFFSASNTNINAGPRRSLSSAVSANAGKLSASIQVARKALPPMIADRNNQGGRNATIERASPGNPSTMAFLGIRAKSSGAAFRQQAEYEEGVDEYIPLGADGGPSNGTAAGAEGRSRQESWMVNLGREDESWLIGPRSGEWFTGLEPSICPGEGEIFATVK
jgi:hypothetical protein